MNGLTSIAALRTLGLRPGDTVLITGGAGVLASYAIPLAKCEGLRVIADARQEDAELLRRLGVDMIVARGDGMARRREIQCPTRA